MALTGGGQGGSVPPQTFDREISADLPGKERQEKKGKWSRKEGKSKNAMWKIENGRRKSYKMRRGTLFFFRFSLLKTTEICFGSTGKKTFHAGENQEKWLRPSKKYSSYAPEVGVSYPLNCLEESKCTIALIVIRTIILDKCDCF